MYIEIHNAEELTQKVLYFKLNNCFNMETENEINHKFCGLYAIYKDDICLYIGQSQNLASRIATHIKGKYKNATNIYLWNIENLGFYDFSEREKTSQKNILNNSEKWLMKELKPIENLDIDMTFDLNIDKTPEFEFYENNKTGICSELSIKIENSSLTIYDNDESLFFKTIGKELEPLFFKSLEEIQKKDIKKAHEIVCFYNNNYSSYARIAK